MKMNRGWHLAINPGRSPKSWSQICCKKKKRKKRKKPQRRSGQTSGETMTSSKIEIPGEVKSDPAALMASLQLMPSPVPNPEIKYTKVCSSPHSANFAHDGSARTSLPRAFLEPNFVCECVWAAEASVAHHTLLELTNSSEQTFELPLHKLTAGRFRVPVGFFFSFFCVHVLSVAQHYILINTE